jgi:hypothetical protein
MNFHPDRNKVDVRISPNSRRQSLLFPAFAWLALAGVAVAGGLSVEIVGTLYVLDIMVLMLALPLTLKVWLERDNAAKRITTATFGFGILVAVFAAMDLINGIPNDDFWRGFARNAVFASAVTVGASISYLWGLRYAVAAWGAASMSVFTGNAIQAPELFTDAVNILKYTGAQAFLYITLCIFAGRVLVSVPIALAAFVILWFQDNRSAALIFVCAAALIGFRRFARGSRVVSTYLLISLIVGGATGWFIYGSRTLASTDYALQRRSTSDAMRVDMAEDAIDGFMAAPILGNGAWQHARQYKPMFNDEFTTRQIIGVHSIVLQMAYEYGILGLLVAGTAVVILISGIVKVLTLPNRDGLAATIPIGLFVLYHLLFSPFANIYRNLYGIGFGVVGFIAVVSPMVEHTSSFGPHSVFSGARRRNYRSGSGTRVQHPKG